MGKDDTDPAGSVQVRKFFAYGLVAEYLVLGSIAFANKTWR